jgi:hypothetical protein
MAKNRNNSDLPLTAVDLIGSVTAVIVSIALSADVNASSIGAAELVAMTFFGEISRSQKDRIKEEEDKTHTHKKKEMSEYI